MRDAVSRRRALALLGFAVAAPHVAARKSAAQSATGVRVVVNRGAENQTLLALLEQQGYAAAMGVAQALVTVAAPAATLEALVEDRADVCVVSGFNGLLPAIEKGAAVKVVGAAQQTAALAVYASRPDIKRVADLAGRTVGIGPDLGLLHVTAIALLRAKGVDPASVKFVNVGANAEVYRDVKAGKIDAGVSDVSNMADADKSRLVTLPDGKMWREIPDYPYQLAYASDRAIRGNRDAIVRILAAYGRMFRFLSAADSFPAYRQARVAGGDPSEEAARAAWAYFQGEQPYANSPLTTAARLEFLQKLHVSVGLQKALLPVETIADLSLARDAAKLI